MRWRWGASPRRLYVLALCVSPRAFPATTVTHGSVPGACSVSCKRLDVGWPTHQNKGRAIANCFSVLQLSWWTALARWPRAAHSEKLSLGAFAVASAGCYMAVTRQRHPQDTCWNGSEDGEIPILIWLRCIWQIIARRIYFWFHI